MSGRENGQLRQRVSAARALYATGAAWRAECVQRKSRSHVLNRWASDGGWHPSGHCYGERRPAGHAGQRLHLLEKHR
jgi:hypothetical protein